MTTIDRPFSQREFSLHGVPWEIYLALRDAPENRHVRMTYNGGELAMMSPSKRHEELAVTIDQLIHVWAEHRDIDLQSCRTMTCHREDLERGFEPDNCYYVQHAAEVVGKNELDLKVDPPPDLAIEIDLARSAPGKLDLYAAFGNPEVWRYDDRALTVYRLDSRGQYAVVTSSEVFPGFPLAEAERLLRRAGSVVETALVKSFRQWLRDHDAAAN